MLNWAQGSSWSIYRLLFIYISWNNSHAIIILLGGSQRLCAFSQLLAFEHAVPAAWNDLPLLSTCLKTSHHSGLRIIVQTTMNTLLPDPSLCLCCMCLNVLIIHVFVFYVIALITLHICLYLFYYDLTVFSDHTLLIRMVPVLIIFCLQ